MGLSNCAQALVALGMQNLPRPEIKPVSPALADRSVSTVPPRKSLNCLLSLSEVFFFSSCRQVFILFYLFIFDIKKIEE